MRDLGELRRRLAEVRIILRLDEADLGEVIDELLEAGRAAGLNPERRAEGYALAPSRLAAALGLPHLRIGFLDNLLMIWVRAPHSLDDLLCEIAGLSAEKLYEMILSGARGMAETLRRHFEEDDVLQISLPAG